MSAGMDQIELAGMSEIADMSRADVSDALAEQALHGFMFPVDQRLQTVFSLDDRDELCEVMDELNGAFADERHAAAFRNLLFREIDPELGSFDFFARYVADGAELTPRTKWAASGLGSAAATVALGSIEHKVTLLALSAREEHTDSDEFGRLLPRLKEKMDDELLAISDGPRISEVGDMRVSNRWRKERARFIVRVIKGDQTERISRPGLLALAKAYADTFDTAMGQLIDGRPFLHDDVSPQPEPRPKKIRPQAAHTAEEPTPEKDTSGIEALAGRIPFSALPSKVFKNNPWRRVLSSGDSLVINNQKSHQFDGFGDNAREAAGFITYLSDLLAKGDEALEAGVQRIVELVEAAERAVDGSTLNIEAVARLRTMCRVVRTCADETTAQVIIGGNHSQQTPNDVKAATRRCLAVLRQHIS